MPTGYFIITGTSRGIGEALAKSLLDDGHYVCGISRGKSDTLSLYENYNHVIFDLSNTIDIELMLPQVIKQEELKSSEMICLINNAEATIYIQV